MAFGLIWDRYKLSERTVTYRIGGENNFYDDLWEGVYCVYTAEQLAAELGCCERTARRCLRDLRDAQIIEWRRATFAGANRIFFRPDFLVWMRYEETKDLPIR